MTIWKFPLHIPGRHSLHMPKGAKILTAQAQLGLPFLWALVDPSAESEVRTLLVVSTGEYFDATRLEYIGTVQLYDAVLVFHVFEELP